MLPKNLEELERVRRECHGMVTARAGISGGAAVVPLPGLDVATDVGLLMALLPEVNRRFGLSPEQIDRYDLHTKSFLSRAVIKTGAKTVGKLLTKELVVQLLKRVGIRVATKQVVKYIPFLGQAAAAALSFGAMKLVGDKHVADCYEVARRVLEDSAKTTSLASADAVA